MSPYSITPGTLIVALDIGDSVPPGVGEIFAVLVGGRARVMRRASPPPLRVRFRAGAAVPWAFTRPKQRDS